jgi:hypothetical protein
MPLETWQHEAMSCRRAAGLEVFELAIYLSFLAQAMNDPVGKSICQGQKLLCSLLPIAFA